jgi:hypothetical protein
MHAYYIKNSGDQSIPRVVLACEIACCVIIEGFDLLAIRALAP